MWNFHIEPGPSFPVESFHSFSFCDVTPIELPSAVENLFAPLLKYFSGELEKVKGKIAMAINLMFRYFIFLLYFSSCSFFLRILCPKSRASNCPENTYFA